MSDFVSDFWGYYVAIGTLLSVAACGWLIWIVDRKPGAADEHATANAEGGVGTTGHTWDGDLQELNNPMPRWWLWLFIITIVFSLVYVALYPGLGRFGGQWGWSQVSQYEQEVTQARSVESKAYAAFHEQTPEQLTSNRSALAIGERLFMNNCAQCHGSDARGSKGFPNLTDADWLYGGSAEAIAQSISKGRHGVMPSMAAAVGSQQEIEQLAHYVMSLSKSRHDSLKAALGRDKFAVCAACHGANGAGNPALGAPNLTDTVWLHGYGQANVIESIRKGRNSVMPAQEGKLSPDQIRVLTAYVLQLSQPAAPAVATAEQAAK